MRRHLSEAEQQYRRHIALRPRDLIARYNLAVVICALDRHDDARAILGEVVRLDSSFSEAWYNLGWLAEQRGDLAEARRCFEQALIGDPDYADAAFNLGRLLFLENRSAEAAPL